MRRHWSLFALALLVVSMIAVTAQPPKQVEGGKWIIPFTVDASASPKPALKYRLLPELRELQPGNQIQAFYKCFFEQNYLFHNKESTDKQQKWLDAPLKDLAAEKELIGYGGSALKQAHYAARLDTVDWQITNQAKADGFGLLLPDLQQMRLLANVLKVRVRGEIARGEFDNAVQTLQTMFALGRTFNEHPTLVGQLVGIAIVTIAVEEVEEFVQQPGAPNLFWSLADLPTPFIDLHKGSQGEKMFLPNAFDPLRKGLPVDASNPDMKKFLGPYTKQAEDKAALTAARERLLGLNYKAADLDKFPPVQLLLLHDFAHYEVQYDEHVKWLNLPFWQIPSDFAKPQPGAPVTFKGVATELGKSGEGDTPSPVNQFEFLHPAWANVILAKVRLQQRFALILTEEGIRAHAGENGGRLPATLDVVKMPLPVDPVTGKSLAYEVADGKGVLYGTSPSLGQMKRTPLNRVYEITIRK